MNGPAPYFEAPGATDARRRLLLVSPAFPPCAEVGALRWQKIAAVAASRGWRLDVITGAALPQDRMDESRLETLPAGTRVWTIPLRTTVAERLQVWAWSALAPIVRGPALRAATPGAAANGGPAVAAAATSFSASPGGLSSGLSSGGALARSLRARNFFASWLLWRDDALRLAREIASAHPPDVVASSGPPHMTHEAARVVASALGRPLVIDLRDPMFVDHAEPEFLASDTWKRNTAHYEATACRDASLVVVNTEASAGLLRGRYPSIAGKLLTVMNGADPDVQSYAGVSDAFRIVHAGNLYGGRDPRTLFRGIRQFLDRLEVTPPHVRVDFVGGQSYQGVPLTEVAAAEGLSAVFTSAPPVAREEALQLLGRAAVLVVLPQAWSLSIPAKVFEYMQFNAALLALCEENDATWQLLCGTGADVVHANDERAIADALLRRHAEWCRGERPVPVNADGRFDRRRQANLLLDALERLT